MRGPRGLRRATAFLGAAMALGALALAPVALAADAAVSIRDFAFRPASVTVGVGDTVTWTNRDDVVHTVRWSDGQPESPGLGQGARYSRTFSRAGTYPYDCGPHPFMTGVVRVVAAGGGPGGGRPGGDAPGTDTSRDDGSPGGLTLPALLVAAGLGGLALVAVARRAAARVENRSGPGERRFP